MIMLTTAPWRLSNIRLTLHNIKTAKPVKTETSLEPAFVFRIDRCSVYIG